MNEWCLGVNYCICVMDVLYGFVYYECFYFMWVVEVCYECKVFFGLCYVGEEVQYVVGIWIGDEFLWLVCQ